MDRQEASQIINDIKRLVEDIEISIKEHLDLNFEEEEAKEIEQYPKSLKLLLAYLKSTNDVQLIKECCNINSRWFHVVRCPKPFYSYLISVTRHLWEIQDYAKEHLWNIPHNDLVGYNFFNGSLYKTLEEGTRELVPLPEKSIKLLENSFEIQAIQAVEASKPKPTNEDLIASLQLPIELNNDDLKGMLIQAINKGLCTIREGIIKWEKTGQLLSYFCRRLSDVLSLYSGKYYRDVQLPNWKLFAPIFDVTEEQLKGWHKDYSKKGSKVDILGKVPKGYEIIEEIVLD